MNFKIDDTVYFYDNVEKVTLERLDTFLDYELSSGKIIRITIDRNNEIKYMVSVFTDGNDRTIELPESYFFASEDECRKNMIANMFYSINKKREELDEFEKKLKQYREKRNKNDNSP